MHVALCRNLIRNLIFSKSVIDSLIREGSLTQWRLLWLQGRKVIWLIPPSFCTPAQISNCSRTLGEILEQHGKWEGMWGACRRKLWVACFCNYHLPSLPVLFIEACTEQKAFQDCKMIVWSLQSWSEALSELHTTRLPPELTYLFFCSLILAASISFKRWMGTRYLGFPRAVSK